MSNAWDKTNPFPSPLPARGGHSGGTAAPSASPEAVTYLTKRVRQTRDFLPDPVPAEALADILDVARWTGSAGNRQPWTFIVVTDPEVKRQMAEAATNTPHIGIAPAVICVALATEGKRDTENFEEGRLAERIMIAATAHGLSCGIGRARPEAQAVIGPLLGCPPDRIVRTMVSIGYPTEAGKAPKSPRGKARKPLAEVVRRERYS